MMLDAAQSLVFLIIVRSFIPDRVCISFVLLCSQREVSHRKLIQTKFRKKLCTRLHWLESLGLNSKCKKLQINVDVRLQIYFHLGFRGFNCPCFDSSSDTVEYWVDWYKTDKFLTLNNDFFQITTFFIQNDKEVKICQFVWKFWYFHIR